MKYNNKWLKAALLLVVAGIIIFCIAFAVTGFDAGRLSMNEYVMNCHTITDGFESISVSDSDAEMHFVPNESGECAVSCSESKAHPHNVFVRNGILTVEADNQRQWYENLLFSTGNPVISISLPASEYDMLSIKNTSGNVTISNDFRFERISIDTVSADVFCGASAGNIEIDSHSGNMAIDGVQSENTTLKSTTGRIDVSRSDVSGSIDVESITGDISLTDSKCGAVLAHSSTGDISFTNTNASVRIDAGTSTGDVSFDRSDAVSINVRTDTGNISGTLLSEKIFIAETEHGNRAVPGTASGGKCELNSKTGNIHISIVE